MTKNADRAKGVRWAGLSATVVLVLALAACHPGIGASSPASSGVASSGAASTSTATQAPAASKKLGGRLTGLQADAKVTRQQSVSGVVDGLPAGDTAWLVVFTSASPAYWPQKGPLPVARSGSFKSTAIFGSAAASNDGQHFILRLVITSAKATTRFKAFLASATAGLPKLPAGVRTLTKVTVVRS